MRSTLATTGLWLCATGCGDDGRPGGQDGSASLTTQGSASLSSTSIGTATDSGDPTGGSVGDDTVGEEGPKFDIAVFDGSGGGKGEPSCKVGDDMDAVGDCEMQAPPDSFEPDVQWSWPPQGGLISIVTPLVVNMTDDDGNGEIDLCDIPDVVVLASVGGIGAGQLHVLDGATGTEHFAIPTMVDGAVSPAVGDIDGDGLVEIVAATPGGLFSGNQPSYLIAFEHDGTMKWQSPAGIDHGQGFAIALADINADGDVEIIADDTVTDHAGIPLWTAPQQTGWSQYDVWHCTATAVADLDGDEQMEIILGQSAYRNDGSVYWNHPEVEPGFPQVLTLDADPNPEVLLTNRAGITIFQHDGAVTTASATPTGDVYPAWFRPATVHDFDGDSVSEIAVSSASSYSVLEPANLLPLWTAAVQDASGWASGTAFDFLGDGVAEAMYADEIALYIFDGAGQSLLTVPRGSPTLIEYPIVVDVDNDGSAEILVVSSDGVFPALQVIRDVEDRWIQARRIWNQHTYHVTNVREDGTIPQHEPDSWGLLNTYRTNAQIEGGGLCVPDPEG